LSVGAQSRIIEFQARREYEAFCSYPLWIVPYEQYALQRAVADNQNIKGFWIWTMYGGPIRRSPMSLFPHTGDLTWISLNAAGTAALAKDPYLDTDSLLTVFLEERFNPDTIAMKVLKDLLNDSHHISRSGLAFPTAVNNSIRGLGTDVPDGIYTYWDLVLASTAVNSILYYAGADEYDKLTEQVQYPVLALNSYTSQLEDLYGHMDSLALNDLLDDLEYETSLFRALELHKEWLLHQYHFLHTGNKDAKVSFMAEADALVKAVEMHETAYTGRLDYRPFSFGDALREVDLSTRADKGEALRWIYFAVAVLLAAMMVSALGNSLPGWFGPFFYLLLAGVGKLDALSRDWALILMAATLVYALILWMRYMRRKPDRIAWNRSWAMLMILQVISLFFSAWRGPLALGYWFWTGNLFRIFLLAVVACLLGLHIVWAVKSAKGWATWLISFGAWISILAVGMGAFWSSLDERLTIVNAQAALLPNSIVHTWGFEQMFGIPHGLVNWVAGAGLVLILVALISLVVFRGVRERRELGEAFRRR